jgi:hypothetical protein
MIFNPLFLHLGNLVSSDGFFLALSLLWFALILWIIHKPSIKIIIWHAVIIFIAFTVRYNAMIYPIIALLAFHFSRLDWKKKLAGISLFLLICGLFVGFTMYKYKRLTGNWQYSPFSGWQLANNAMYAYRYVESGDRKPVPKKFQKLDNMIREYFDSTRNTLKFPTEAIQASTFYMWSPSMPLVKYRNKLFIKDSAASELKKWASMGPLYKEYGIYIIKQYPWQFTRHFVWPNANKYYSPPIELLQNYNSGKTSVPEQVKNWFGYPSRILKTRIKNIRTWILDFYPILSGVINVLMICCIMFYLLMKGWHYNQIFKYGLCMGGTVWVLNASFTILASSAALRFQSFPIILTSMFVILTVDWLVKLIPTKRKEEVLKYEHSEKVVVA